MRRLVNRALALLRSPWGVPLMLLLTCAAAYSLWMPQLGFYWDSWPMNWIAQTMGSQGLARYFSTNRPVWGLFYQLTTPLLGAAPLPWQVAALLLRWLTGVAVWVLARLLWPEQKPAAAWISLLFVVYPGFRQQSIGLLYTHFFIVLNAYLWSLAAALAALRRPRHRRALTAAALLLSLVNLLSMEYFFILELLRPLLFWLVLAQQVPGWRARWLPALRAWLPYLVLFLAAGIWRALFFPYTQNNYQLVVLEQLKAQPLLTLWQLALKVVEQFWIVLVQAWRQVLIFPDDPASPLAGGYWMVVILSAVLLAAWLFVLQRAGRQPQPRNSGWQMLALGGAALLLAGWPFWLTDVPFSLQFAYDRFTLPFMLGVSLLVGGVFHLLPLGRLPRAALLAGLAALAVGSQVSVGYTYVQDWNAQKNFFWQLTWRAPALQPDTLLISNEMRYVHFSTDNSLTAPLNWIYAPSLQEHALENGEGEKRLAVLLVYPTIRLEYTSLPALEKGLPSYENYLVASFRGSTDQALGLYFDPPGCLHVLEPWQASSSLPEEVRQAAALSDPSRIITAPEQPARPIPQIFGAEPPHGWCYFYQKASLARQQQQWQQVAALYDEAGRLGLEPGLPEEWLPFIEAQARLGNWPGALSLSLQAAQGSPSPREQVCLLWQRMLPGAPASPERDAAFEELQVKLDCGK